MNLENYLLIFDSKNRSLVHLHLLRKAIRLFLWKKREIFMKRQCFGFLLIMSMCQEGYGSNYICRRRRTPSVVAVAPTDVHINVRDAIDRRPAKLGWQVCCRRAKREEEIDYNPGAVSTDQRLDRSGDILRDLGWRRLPDLDKGFIMGFGAALSGIGVSAMLYCSVSIINNYTKH